MFDDQPMGNNSSQTPGNLPLGEPQDMFENVDSNDFSEPISSPQGIPQAVPPLAEAPRGEITTALDAGILKPKAVNIAPPVLGAQSTPPNAVMDQNNHSGENAIKDPTLSRGIMVAVMATVIGFVLVGAGWFAYKIFTKEDASIVVPAVDIAPVIDTTKKDVAKEEPVTPLESVIVTSSEDSVDQEILVGETPDTDGDGLKDIREKELGTDGNNWDTDNDDLSDGEEIFIWHTDPLKGDTDGDTYIDSAEIRAGYNPAGPGRIGELQTTSSNTTTSSSVETAPMASATTSAATSTSPSQARPTDFPNPSFDTQP